MASCVPWMFFVILLIKPKNTNKATKREKKRKKKRIHKETTENLHIDTRARRLFIKYWSNSSPGPFMFAVPKTMYHYCYCVPLFLCTKCSNRATSHHSFNLTSDIMLRKMLSYEQIISFNYFWKFQINPSNDQKSTLGICYCLFYK